MADRGAAELLRLALVFCAVVIATFLLHEAAHAVAAGLLGYPVRMDFNSVAPIAGEYRTGAHRAIVDAAGPAVTVAVAAIAFAMSRGRMALLIVLAAFVMRLFASVVSLANPNDEMRLGAHLGLSPWLLPALVTLVLGTLTVAALRRSPIGWRQAIVLWLSGSVAITALVMGDGRTPGLVLFA